MAFCLLGTWQQQCQKLHLVPCNELGCPLPLPASTSISSSPRPPTAQLMLKDAAKISVCLSFPCVLSQPPKWWQGLAPAPGWSDSASGSIVCLLCPPNNLSLSVHQKLVRHAFLIPSLTYLTRLLAVSLLPMGTGSSGFYCRTARGSFLVLKGTP